MKFFPSITVIFALVSMTACSGSDPARGGAGADADPPPAEATVRPIPERPVPTEQELADLTAAVERAPDDSRARRRLAIALFEAGRTDESLAMFEEDARDRPGAASLLNLGRAYDRVLRYGDAERTYRRVLELAPDHPTALHALGNLALKRGDREEAIALYRRAVQRKPDYLMALAHLGDALRQGGDDRAAYEAYAAAVDLQPKSAQEMQLYQDAVYSLASIDLAQGKAERAAGMLQQLLAARPDHAKAHYAHGQALTLLGRTDEAQHAFERHMELQAGRKASGPAAMGD